MPDEDPGLEEFAAYARERGLTLEPGARLPRATPLLAEGELRSVEALMSGWLGTYLEAKLALVTRDEVTTDATGKEIRGEAHLTVALTHVPKAKRFVPWMLCHRVEDAGLLGEAAERLIHGNDRVDLESAELDRRYRIYASPQRDDVWLHELFSPSFIVWLLEKAPSGLAFEYVEGSLCVSLVGRRTLTEDLDGLRDATVELVARMRAEIREALGHAEGRSAPDAPGYPTAPAS
ncbi:MAG TPA: hypothetical protein VF731_12665 [Solirubrobacterales bacterium]